ncbi:MAG TPA: HEAT repeat domain-containing protein [Planctomycetota bacterium]|nr:HEAT repeat domain-containing protein [Planctomycetota bacterium]
MTTVAVVWLALAVAALQGGGETAVEEALRKLRDAMADPRIGPDEKAAAVIEAAGTRHEKVARALGALLVRSAVAVPVRIVAARELGRFEGSAGAVEGLVRAVRSSENAGGKALGVRIEALRGLGRLRARAAAGTVDRLIEDRDLWVAKAAIDAAGRIGSLSSVDPLIRALRRVEGPQGDQEVVPGDLFGGALPGHSREGSGGTNSAPRTERALLREPILQALRAVTGHDAPDARAWAAWWRKRRGGMKLGD